MSTINRAKLSVIIKDRMDGVVSKNSISDAISIICDIMTEKLIEGEAISINNFGTLDTYTHHGHDGLDISTGEIQYVEPFMRVKFIPHNNLMILFNRKKSEFKKEKEVDVTNRNQTNSEAI
jgi:nucleoid DNA-binding protein